MPSKASSLPRLVAVATSSSLLAVLVASSLVGGALSSAALSTGPVGDIPPRYLEAYVEAAQQQGLGPDGWSYLAGIGKVESDHGRSTAPGVRSGQNTNGCCAGPMQIDNGGGTGGGTWRAFRVDGNADGLFDIYVPEDAAATAAHYLRSSGAPRDWRAALFAYNHASWYVEEVSKRAAAYRAAVSPLAGDDVAAGSSWLAPVPGFPRERCDRRIAGEAGQLARTFGLVVTGCFGGEPHAIDGEHPLGLAVDYVPADDDWSRTARLARASGWTSACAAAGCPGRGPFRVVLYNGFPGHGDPAHSQRPHLHLSWQHGPAAPFTRAPWVRLVLSPITAP